MRRKLIMILLCVIFCTSMLVGCGPYEISEETAVQLTQEYMKEKYEKEVRNVTTQINSRGGQHNVKVNFQIEDDNKENQTFEVCVEVDENDKKTHYIKSDDYMKALVTPLLVQNLRNTLKKNGFKEFSIYVLGVQQPESGVSNGFFSEFPIPKKSAKFEEIMQSGTLFFRFELFIPQNDYDEKVCSELETLIGDLVDDDILWIYVAECQDADYEDIKNSILQNDEAKLAEILSSNSSVRERFVSFEEIKINQPILS